jgi:hypothetical protein
MWSEVPWEIGGFLCKECINQELILAAERLDPSEGLLSQGSKGGMSTLTYFSGRRCLRKSRVAGNTSLQRQGRVSWGFLLVTGSELLLSPYDHCPRPSQRDPAVLV